MKQEMFLVRKERVIVEILIDWRRKNRRTFPWREAKDPYVVLVAEFFLQRTPANRVAALLPKFIAEFPSPEKLAHANINHLKEVYGCLGLKKRMSWLVESMKIICQSYGGRIPNTLEDLLSLPGVGEYTASAVLCFGYGCDIPIVDANVVRVLTRIFGLPETNRTGTATLKKIARGLIPIGHAIDYNESILDFAALVCKKRPLHDKCPLTSSCDYYQSIYHSK